MNWNDWKTWAQKQRKRTSWSLVLELVPPWEKSTEQVEFKNMEAIDQMVQVYCRCRRWPKMSKEQRCLLYYRMEHAEGLVALLATSGFSPPPGQRFSKTVEWLLVTSWRAHGWDRWVEHLEWSRMVGRLATLQRTPVLPERPEDGFAA